MSPACRLVATWSVASSLSRLVATCMVGRVELDACLAWLVPMSPACRLVATCMVGRVELDACLAWLVPMSPVCRLVATWSVASSLSRLVATCMVVPVDVASVSVGCNLVGRVELDACLARSVCEYRSCVIGRSSVPASVDLRAVLLVWRGRSAASSLTAVYRVHPSCLQCCLSRRSVASS